MFTREDDAYAAPTVEERRLAELQFILKPVAARYRQSFKLWFVSMGLFILASTNMPEAENGYNIWSWVGLASFCLWIISVFIWLSVRNKRKAINGEIAAQRKRLGMVAGQELPTTTGWPTATDQATRTDGFHGLDLGYLARVVDAHDADTLILNFKYQPEQVGSPAFHQLLDDLGFNPTATIARLASTSALDGNQSAESDTARAYWSYHPDKGLKMIFERK